MRSRPFSSLFTDSLLFLGGPLLLELLVYLAGKEIFPSTSPLLSILLTLLYASLVFAVICAAAALLLTRIPLAPEALFPALYFGLFLALAGSRLLPYDSGFSLPRIAVFTLSFLLSLACCFLLSHRRPERLRILAAEWIFCAVAAASLAHLFQFPLHSPVTVFILFPALLITLLFLPGKVLAGAAVFIFLLQLQSRTVLPAFAPPTRMAPYRRVIFLGVDGLSPEVTRKMVARGELPSFARMMSRGTWGRLHTLNTPFSPLVWNTIYTGTAPGKHGILAFTQTGVAGAPPFLSLWLDNWTNSDWMHGATKLMNGLGAISIVAPATGKLRREPALWNIVEQNGAASNVVGGWTTYPPEIIRGTFVSDYAPSARTPLGTYYPISRKIDEILAGQLTLPDAPEEIQRYRVKDVRMHRISMELLRPNAGDFRFHFAYYCAVDAFSHHFGTYMDMKSTPPSRKEELGQMRDEVYRSIDRFLADYLPLVDSETLLIVASDHGFHFDKRQHNYPVDGMVLLLGREVRENTTIEESVYDLAPTITYALGIPASTGFQGRAMKQAFEGMIPEPAPRAYERGQRFFEAANREELDEQKLQELEDLQYIDR